MMGCAFILKMTLWQVPAHLDSNVIDIVVLSRLVSANFDTFVLLFIFQ